MKNLLLALFTLTLFSAHAQDNLTTYHKQAIADFISHIKKNDKEALAKKITYPFKRQYPLPSIKNKAEFLKRYAEVFDSKLISLISKSDPGHDWYAGGYRGIMFMNGQLWLEYDGSLIAVNYQTKAEADKRAALIAKEKKGLHASVRGFSEPVCILLTAKYRIRIDMTAHGTYRYAAWKQSAKMSTRPDLVINGGQYVPDGSGGNHHYTFKNNIYTYECGITPLGEDNSAPAYLTVYKNDAEIVHQPATIAAP